jgi:hypothetical protein
MTLQLRRYALHPHLTDEFLSWFPSLVPARAAFGFSVEHAYVDRAKHEFTWVVSHPGTIEEFQAAEAAWFSSPERDALFAGRPAFAAEMFVSMVDEFIAPSR